MHGCVQVSNQEGYQKETAARLTKILLWVSAIGFPFVGIALAGEFFVPFFWTTLSEKVIVSKLTFVNMGILFAVFQLMLGVLLSLIGVTANYNLDASVGAGKLKLISASPGILLIVAANVVFAFSLMREFEVMESTTEVPESPAGSPADNSIPTPTGTKGP